MENILFQTAVPILNLPYALPTFLGLPYVEQPFLMPADCFLILLILPLFPYFYRIRLAPLPLSNKRSILPEQICAQNYPDKVDMYRLN